MALVISTTVRAATTAAVAVAAGLANGSARPCAAQGLLSEHAVAAQTIAGTTITVEYYRPAARGRDPLFGKVVTWGEHWTPGANWATTVDVDHDVRVNGSLLPKGKYALWTVVQPDRWTVELRRQWHKFHVPPPTDSSDVQLRLTVRSDSGPATELLTFDFPAVRPAATMLRLRWGTVVGAARDHRAGPAADPAPLAPRRRSVPRPLRSPHPGRRLDDQDVEIVAAEVRSAVAGRVEQGRRRASAVISSGTTTIPSGAGGLVVAAGRTAA